jgi:DNA-binding protein H-NS
MQLHGVSIEDFGAESRTKPVKTKGKGSVAAQFKNPETGETWTGRGRAPRWLVGKDREAYRIEG